MALINCKDCGQKFSTDAKRCPHCGAKKPPKDRSMLYKVILFLFILCAVQDLFIAPQTRLAQQQETRKLIDAGRACDTAQKAVKQLLNSPSTAKFPTCIMGLAEHDIRESQDKKTIAVSGYVDAQNSFGAMLRKPWSVQLKRADAESEELKVVKVSFEGKTIPFK